MNLTGFLHGKYARIFMQELWELLVSAQENIGGVPTRFIEQKKEEIRLKKVCSWRFMVSFMYVINLFSKWVWILIVLLSHSLKLKLTAKMPSPHSPHDMCTYVLADRWMAS